MVRETAKMRAHGAYETNWGPYSNLISVGASAMKDRMSGVAEPNQRGIDVQHQSSLVAGSLTLPKSTWERNCH